MIRKSRRRRSPGAAKAANQWFDHTLYSRLNDKRRGAILPSSCSSCSRTTSSATSSRRSRGSSCAFRQSPKRTRRITARRSGDRNAFWRRQGEALHPERKLLESLDGIRRAVGESTSLLQRVETSSDATRLLCPDCGSRRPARPPRVARNWNFESSSLQRRVCKLSVPIRVARDCRPIC